MDLSRTEDEDEQEKHQDKGAGCLPNHDYIAYLQTALYFSSVILGFIVAVPIGILLRNFHGSCILFGELIWSGSYIWPYSDESCDFIMYSTIALGMFYAVIMGLYSILLLLKKKSPRFHNEKLMPLHNWHVKFVLQGMNPVMIVINAIAAVFMLSSAAVLTAGLNQFCTWMRGSLALQGIVLAECKDAESMLDWSKISIYGGDSQGVKGDNFFQCLIIALVGSWLLTGVWTVQLILNIAMTCRRCSCDIAEEKRKPDNTLVIAQRRSGIATPLRSGAHTPGHMTPPNYGPGQQQQMMPPQRGFNLLPPPMKA